MAIHKLDDSLMSSELILAKPGWSTYLARWISHVVSPPILIVGMMLLTTSVVADNVWGKTAVYLTLTLGIPIAYVAYLVQQDKATDFDVSVRRQRVVPTFVSLGGSTAGLLYYILSSVPRLLIMLAAANLLITFVIAGTTIFWKISIHTTTSAASAILVWVLLGTPAFLLTVPMIIWSRVHLHRHTLLQTVAGAMLGSLVIGTMFFVWGG
jgi:membrane-associated phospholipid phosphatase